MVRMSDRDKLMILAKKYFKRHGKFTSAMLFHYILRQEIKFKKDMNTRRIGKMISDSGKYNKIRKSGLIYYEAI